MTIRTGDKGDLSFGKLPEKKGVKRAREEKVEKLFVQSPHEDAIPTQKKMKISTTKRAREEISQVSAKLLMKGDVEGESLQEAKRAPTLVEIESQEPDDVVQQLLEQIQEKQLHKKDDELVVVFFTKTGKMKVQLVPLNKIDTDFYKAALWTDVKLKELCDHADKELVKEFTSVLKDEYRPLVRDQLKMMDTTIGLIETAMKKYPKDKEKQGTEIHTLFRVLKNQAELHQGYLQKRKITRSQTQPFEECRARANDLIQSPVGEELQLVSFRPGEKSPHVDFMNQVLLSGMVDVNEPEYYDALVANEQALKQLFAQGDVKVVRELVWTYPELLDHPNFPETYFNDFKIIYNAVMNDPTACLRMGDELKKNPELAKRIAKDALASLILVKHPKEILDKSQEIHAFCKQFLPQVDAKGIENIETYLEVQHLLMHGGVFDENARKSINTVLDTIRDPSYQQFVESLQSIKKQQNQKGKERIGPPPLEDINKGLWAMTSRSSIIQTPDYRDMTPCTMLLNSKDRDVASTAIEWKASHILWADTSIQLDPDFKEAYLKDLAFHLTGNAGLFTSSYIPKQVKEDVSFICSALEKEPNIYRYLTPEIKESGKDLFAQALIRGIANRMGYFEISIDRFGEVYLNKRGEDPIPVHEILENLCASYGIEPKSKVFDTIEKGVFDDKNRLNTNNKLIVLASETIRNDPKFKSIFIDRVKDLAFEYQLNVLNAPFFSEELRGEIVSSAQEGYIDTIAKNSLVSLLQNSDESRFSRILV